MRKRLYIIQIVIVLPLLTYSVSSVSASLPVGQAIESISDRLDVEQIKTGVLAGSWATEASFTGSIVAGMASAYEKTCNSAYKDSAELGGAFILSSASGNFYGDEAFALTGLSQIADDPANNAWRTAVGDFYDNVKNSGDGTEGYISWFLGTEPSTAVFYLAHYTVAAFYVDAEDRQIWRQGLIDWLAEVDDESSDFPVMALGVATWALAQTGPLDATLVDPSGTSKPYWNLVTLAELPDILISHQIAVGDPNAGIFYWRFDHGDGGSGGIVSGYTEDTIFGTLGLAAASGADPALEMDEAIFAGRHALLDGIGPGGMVWERLSQEDGVYYAYAGEMLTVLAKLIISGDINLDGGVDFPDFAAFADNWHSSDCVACSWCNCSDLNHNGDVDFSDFKIIADNWLKGTGY